MFNYYKKHFLGCEFVLSVGITLVGAAGIYVSGLDYSALLKDIRTSLYFTIAQIFGTLLGFVIAAVTILLTMKRSAALKLLEQSPIYYQVYEVFISSAKVLSSGTFIAIFAGVFDRDSAPKYFLTILVCFLVILVSFRIGRCLWILENIIALQIKNNKRNN